MYAEKQIVLKEVVYCKVSGNRAQVYFTKEQYGL